MLDNETLKQMAHDAAIHETILSDEIVDLPSRISYWGHKHAEAADVINRAKVVLEIAKAEALLSAYERIDEIKAEFGKDNQAIIEAVVLRDPGVKAATEGFLDAKAELDALSAHLKALSAKKDMIVTFAANSRAEMGGMISMRAPQADEDDEDWK